MYASPSSMESSFTNTSFLSPNLLENEISTVGGSCYTTKNPSNFNSCNYMDEKHYV
jgi:hypothetical protein